MNDGTRAPTGGSDALPGLADLLWTDHRERCSALFAEGDALSRLVGEWNSRASRLVSEIEELLGGYGLSDEAFAAASALLGIAGLFHIAEELSLACQLEPDR